MDFEVTFRNEGIHHPETIYRVTDPTGDSTGEGNLEDIYANVYSEPDI